MQTTLTVILLKAATPNAARFYATDFVGQSLFNNLPHTPHAHRCCTGLCMSTLSHHAPTASCKPHHLFLQTGNKDDTFCWLKNRKTIK